MRIGLSRLVAICTLSWAWPLTAQADEVVSPAHSAQAPSQEPHRVPYLELRGFGGLFAGGELAASVLEHRLRVEAAGRTSYWRYTSADFSAQARLLGTAYDGLWVRAGYQIQGSGHCNDGAGTWDLGVAFRHRTVAGSLFALEAGMERLRRDKSISCNDSTLPASSQGARLSVIGQLALTRNVGLFARLGLRTAAHILEIGVMPQAEAGLAIEL